MTGPGPILELQGLRVARGGVPVLDVEALAVHERELLALVGPNGAGKSTLLLAVMGLLPREAGRVLHRGRAVEGEGGALALRRRIGLVSQEPTLFDTTVLGNVAAGLRIRGLPRREVRERAMACLERLGLAHLALRSARALSGGEARRVSLARAVVTEPELMLLDEPFANLDAPTREQLVEDVRGTVRAAGMAAILVTHDRFEALRLSDRILVMQSGRIVQAGPPSEVMNAPASAFVAAYMGMETIVEGVVRERHDHGIAVAVGDRSIAAVSDHPPGTHVYCCLRPENVTLALEDPGATSARNVFPARVTGLSSMGGFVKVGLDCGFRLVAYVTPESYAILGLELGRPLYASFKATAVHIVKREDAGPGGTAP